ncbi:YciI family protein [Nocardioides sp. Bht2]|uniref:YciI family protein n=1 Tax=Nocardioides sp. Bht2 TaxID=3392297 RepID=UPI0039B40047
MKYLILMQINPAVLEALTPEQQQALGDGHTAFVNAAKENGEFISTQACADPSRSKVVRAVDGIPTVSDGPFVEAKEFLGGFYLVDVENEERAVELALQIPDVQIPGLAVEIRPVIFADLGDG